MTRGEKLSHEKKKVLCKHGTWEKAGQLQGGGRIKERAIVRAEKE